MTMYNLTDNGTRTNMGALKAGDVIRVFDGAFGDAVILGFDASGGAKCSRPYAYASNVGTTGPTVLLGSETIKYPKTTLALFSRIVGNERMV